MTTRYFITFHNGIFFKSFICVLLVLLPNMVMSESKNINIWLNYETEKKFTQSTYQDDFHKETIGFEIKANKNKVYSNLTLNLKKNKKIVFDHSYLTYSIRNNSVGIGKIARHWSFSPRSSLILSSNSRPSDSIFFTIANKDKSTKPILSWIGPWSIEAFNSSLSNKNTTKDTMLLGTRIVFEPINHFKFELVKTSQWGGSGNSNSLSAFSKAIIGNTNDNKHSKINQLAGFGLSYLLPTKKSNLTIYGQFIGEDEAGGLPSCYMYLYGTEWVFPEKKYLKKLGFELIDTRIDETTMGACGPNTAYNNSSYQYTNYDISLGSPIDTESKSISFWTTSSLSPNINLNYSLEKFLLNDTGWDNHRLTSTQKKGWTNSLSLILEKESYKIQSKLSHQSFNLDNAQNSKGLSLKINILNSF